MAIRVVSVNLVQGILTVPVLMPSSTNNWEQMNAVMFASTKKVSIDTTFLLCVGNSPNFFLITKIYLDPNICTCLPGFSATDANEYGAAKCEADCALNNVFCQLGAHCPQECSCPSGYQVVIIIIFIAL